MSGRRRCVVEKYQRDCRTGLHLVANHTSCVLISNHCQCDDGSGIQTIVMPNDRALKRLVSSRVYSGLRQCIAERGKIRRWW